MRDPLEPAATAVYAIATMVALVLAATLAATLFGSGSMFNAGAAVCVDARAGQVPVRMWDSLVPEARDGVQSTVATIQLCAAPADAGQRALGALVVLPTVLLVVVPLGVALRLFRVARRHGPFTARTVRLLRALGWFLFAGALVASLVETVARHQLIAGMVDGPLPGVLTHWSPPWATVLFGLALVSVARLMSIGTGMRRDLDLTV